MKNQPDNPLSLGEGNTPLLRFFCLEKKLSWQGELWAKCEYQNPTGSFKDRGSIVEVTEALVQNKTGTICASTGNMAASLAAYTTKAKLSCFVVVPSQTPEAKLHQALMCGANLIKINGGYDDCVQKAITLAKQKKLLLCGDYELRRKGQQTISTELADSGINFDTFIVPIGNGTLGCAIAEGFSKFNKYPQFIGVQGIGADPIYRAWKNKREIISIKNPKTIASAMKVGNPLDGNLTLEWIKKTGGAMYAVNAQEIKNAQTLLAKTEGIFVETTGAATVACVTKIENPKNQKIVLILTGSGLKEIS